MLNLNQFSISAKLFFFFIIPLITIVIFSFTSAHDKYQKLENTQYVINALSIVSIFDDLTYGLQRERDLTAGLEPLNKSNTQSSHFDELIRRQFKINDELITRARKRIQSLPDFLSPKLQVKWEQISSQLSKIPTLRTNSSSHTDYDSFNQYSQIMLKIINFIEHTQNIIEDSELSNLSSSFINLQWIIEHASLERGELNKVLSSGNISPLQIRSILSNITGQRAALRRFSNLASDKHLALVNSQLNNQDYQKFNSYRDFIFSKAINESSQKTNQPLKTPSQFLSEIWWLDASKRIEALHNISKKLIDDMFFRSYTIFKDAQTILYTHSLLALITIIICTFLGLKIRSRLVGEIGYIAKTMRDNSNPESSNILLREQGNDEISGMAKAYNHLIHQRSNNENTLRLAAQVFKDAHEGILITDLNSSIVDVNPTFCEITGYSREEVLGNTPSMLSSGKQSPEFYVELWESITSKGFWHGEIWNRRKNGEIYPEILTITALKNEQEQVTNYVAIFTDISEMKNQQKQLEELAYYDPLTKLPNRTLFADRFTIATSQCKRHNSLLAICFLDLDDFKPVNDKYGHDVGDLLLVAVAERITTTLRESDSVFRQGGDEFIVLLGGVYNISQIEKLLDRLLFCIAQPYLIEEKYITISVTAGISVYPSDNPNLDTLIRHADQAMYKAKLKGKRCYSFYNLEEEQKTITKHHHLQEIKDAIANDQFELFYQPKINMVTGHIYGAEALIRWNKPNIGIVPPLEFLPIIEGTDLDIQIGEWVINNALHQAKAWLQYGLSIEISINISPHHLLSDVFIYQLETALNKYPDFDSEQLQIEVLESEVISDVNKIAKVMKTCRRELGVHFALDDFGTGYSSLSHLRDLPAKTIKIDQTFVRDMLHDPNDSSIIDGIIGLANSFGRDIIAEGVETNEHGLMLLMMGCRDAQGYGIARPMPAKNIINWIENYTANQSWINFGKEDLSISETSLEQFRLTSNYWFDQFRQGVVDTKYSIPSWTLKSHTKCQCGEWIKRAKVKKSFDPDWLLQLEKAHHDIHLQANQLYNHTIVDGLRQPEIAIKQLDRTMSGINDLTHYKKITYPQISFQH